MAITLDKILGAYKQRIPMVKTSTATVVAGLPSTVIDKNGFPAAGSLNPSQTTNGVVPTNATAGYPRIEAPSGSNRLYLSRVEVAASVGMSVEIFDCIFQAGQTTIPTSGTTTVTLSSIPSIASRIPYMADGTTKDYQSLQLFIQMSVAGSAHAHTTSIDYLDQGGAAGNTGNVSTNAFAVNRLIRCPLAAGDTGVQGITGYNVNGATSSTGAVTVQIMRSLGRYRTTAGNSNIYGPDYTGLPELFGDSALLLVVYADSTSSGIPSVNIEIAHIDPAA